jgi:hypothetical protein
MHMHIITNTKLVKSRSAWSSRFMLGGFALILGSAVLTFLNPEKVEYILPAYGALIGGFIIFNIGASLASKWRREPRADQAIERALKGLDNRFRLYNFLLPVDHVLLTPTGLTVFQVRRLPGQISCTGDRWDHKRSLLSRLRFSAEEQVGNPTRDVQNDIKLLQNFLAAKLDDADVPIDGVILFSHPAANLTLNNPTLPVWTPKEAKLNLRQTASQRPKLHIDTYNELADLFDAAEGGEEVEASSEPEPAGDKASKAKRPKAK